MTDEQEDAKRAWLEGHLDWAARHFDVQRFGQTVHGPRVRSAGVAVRDHDGPAWLRVVYEDPDWGQGDYLDGNLTANEIRNVPKPLVKRWADWDDQSRRIRGEVHTYIPDRPLSTDMVLDPESSLSDVWLNHLRAALDSIAEHPAPRHGLDLDDINHGLLAFFGVHLDEATITWTTAHCDLHWGNVTAPTLTILDWETWGRAPAGYDAATLYLTSLLDPNCPRIYQAFATLLDTQAGRCATLCAAVRLLRFIDSGEMTSLARPLREHAERIAGQL